MLLRPWKVLSASCSSRSKIVLGAARGWHAQTLAQQGDVGMLRAELELRAVRQAHGRGVGAGGLGGSRCAAAATRLEQGLAQALELLVPGMQRAQVVARRVGSGHGIEHGLGLAQCRLHVEVLAERGRVEPAAAGMARILEDGEAELDLGGGEHGCRRLALRQLRQLEGARGEAPVVGLGDLGHGMARPGREAVLGDPQEGCLARCIVGRERGAVGALDVAARGLGELATYLCEQRVDRRRWRRLGYGGRRRGWSRRRSCLARGRRRRGRCGRGRLPRGSRRLFGSRLRRCLRLRGDGAGHGQAQQHRRECRGRKSFQHRQSLQDWRKPNGCCQALPAHAVGFRWIAARSGNRATGIAFSGPRTWDRGITASQCGDFGAAGGPATRYFSRRCRLREPGAVPAT